MSLFQRTFSPLRTSSRVLQSRALLTSSFHTSSAQQALSESDTNAEDKHDRDAKIEHHKQDSIEKAKAGKGEWKPELASNSEQAQAADKHDLSIDEMQKLGEKKGKEDK